MDEPTEEPMEEPTEEPMEEPTEEPMGPVEIDLWYHSGRSEERDAMGEILDNFAAENPDIIVNRIELPEGDYNAQVQAAAVAGDLPCVLDFDGPNVYNYVWAGYLIPLDDYMSDEMKADFLPSIIEQGTYQDGKIYSLGQFDSGLGIWAHKSYLEEAGVRIPTIDDPWTGEEFNDALAALQALDDVEYALDMKMNYVASLPSEWLTYGFSPLLQSFGGDLIDRSTYKTAEGVLNGPEAVEAMTTVQGWFDAGYVNPSPASDTEFTEGKAALSWVGHWVASGYMDAVGDDLLLLPFPDFGTGVKTGMGSWNWGITTNCEHPDAAWEVLNYMVSPESILIQTNENGAIPARKSALEESELYAEGTLLNLFVEQIEAGWAVPRPITPAYPTITAAFSEAFWNIRAGSDVQDELDNAVDTIDADLEANDYYGVGEAPPAEEEEPMEAAEIDLWYHSGRSEERDAMGEILDNFAAENPNITVNRIELPEGDYNAQVQAAAVAGDLPCVLDFDGPNVYNYVWAGYLIPLDDYMSDEMKADFLPSIIDQGTYQDGKIYSLGQFDSGLGIWAHKSYLEEAGVRIPTVDDPWTGEEFNDALAALQALDDVEYALDMKMNYVASLPAEWLTYGFSPLLQSFGGDLIDRSTYKTAEGVLNGPEAVEAMTTVQGWFDAGYVNPSPASDTEFTEGKAALSWVGHWVASGYMDAVGDDLLLLPFPDFGTGPKTGMGSWNWGITTNCERPDAAWAVLNYMVSPESILIQTNENGAIPARKSALEQSELYAEDTLLNLFVEQIEAGWAVPRPITAAYPTITAAFSEAFWNIRAGSDVQDELDNAVDTIDADLEANDYYGVE